jgi:hypothetical protein
VARGELALEAATETIGGVAPDPRVRAKAPARSLPFMMVMAVAVGVVEGLGAWDFGMLIGLERGRSSAHPRFSACVSGPPPSPQLFVLTACPVLMQ